VGIVENFRRVVVEGTAPDLPTLLYSLLVTVVFVPAAYLYFKKREATMADVI
jgi:ABC-type polysaccharide/polyol phosphate export permease